MAALARSSSRRGEGLAVGGISARFISASDQGRFLLQRNGCVACHDRNVDRGLSSIANTLQRLIRI